MSLREGERNPNKIGSSQACMYNIDQKMNIMSRTEDNEWMITF